MGIRSRGPQLPPDPHAHETCFVCDQKSRGPLCATHKAKVIKVAHEGATPLDTTRR